MAGETKLGTAQVPIRATLDELDKDLEAVRGHVESALSGVQDLGKIALGGLAAGALGVAGAIATIGPAAIGAASDLNESVSKATVVFGDAIGPIQAFAATSAESFGIAKQTAYEMTGTFGNLFTTMGVGKGAAADMSVDIVKLAADLASFNNLSTDEVLQKLKSGLVGEIEPLRSLGVSFTEDQVKAKALAMGLTQVASNSATVAAAEKRLAETRSAVADITRMYGVNSKQVQKGLADIARDEKALAAARAGGVGPLTESAKLQARYALILEQTTTAQGDFARTSDGAANSMRINEAMMKDLLATIGTAFLPLWTSVLKTVGPIVKALLPSLQDGLKKLSPILTDVGNSTGIFVEALIRTGDPIYALSGALENFPDLKSTFDGLVAGVQAFLTSIQPTLDQVMAWISQNVSLKDVLIAIGIAIASVVIPAILSAAAAAAPIIAAFVALVAVVSLVRQAWEENWGGIRDTLTAAWTGTIQPALAELWAWLQTNLPAALKTLADFWTGTLQPALMQVLGFIQGSVLPALGELWAWLNSNVPAAIKTVADFVNGTLIPALQAMWTFLQTYIIPVWQAVASVISIVLGAALAGLVEYWNSVLYPMLQALWDFISNSVIPLFAALAELVATVVVKAFEGWWFILNNSVLPIIKMIWDWINGKLIPIFRDVATVVVDVLGAAFEWARVHILNPFIDALSFIKGFVDEIIEAIHRMQGALAGTRLPGGDGAEAKAAGGPVARGMPYIVGERGPELFVPDASGAIVPSRETTRAGNSYNLYVTTTMPVEDITADFGMLAAMAA